MVDITTTSDPNQTNVWPKPIRAWGLVILLTVIYVLSFIDRYILGLLIEPIKKDLGLTDTQIGLLLGPSFAIFYAVMGLPLGWLADRKRRTWIIGIGLGLWSIATALSGLSKNFLQIFLARIGVGVGEATLSPCAMSLMADSFPPEKRGKPIALYSTAISVGAGLAALTGAAVITWATQTDTINLPYVGVLKPWQLTMIIVGLPGLFLMPLMFLVREPSRKKNTIEVAEDAPPIREVFAFLKSKWLVAIAFISIFCFTILIGYSTSWGAPTFERTWGWSNVKYAKAVGITLLLVGPTTVYFSGWLSDKFYSRGQRAAPFIIALAGIPIMFFAAIAWPLMPTGNLAMFVLGITLMGSAISSATGVTALLNIIPANMRGQIIAIYYMTTSLFGIGFGPLSIGLMNDHIYGESGLHYSMATLPLIFGLPIMIFLPKILKLYREELRVAEK